MYSIARLLASYCRLCLSSSTTDGGVWAVIHHVAPGQPPEWAGYVAVLDTQHVTLLRTVRVGRDPRGIAVDEQAGHAFVANYWGDSVSVLDTTR